MFYEGTEKRLEIIVKEADLHTFPEQFWRDLVAQADAFVLSKIQNQDIHAYLLSESSLFVWKNRVLLITCGNTQLVNAAHFFQKHFPKNKIQALIFHRHQSIQPELQKTNFHEDAQSLSNQLKGGSQHYSENYQGDLFFFGSLNNELLNRKEILMLQGLSGGFAEHLQNGEATNDLIESKLGIKYYFPQFTIDQFTFTPKGYSLNGINSENYLTIHITPEKLSTYLSLESSLPKLELINFIDHLKQIFQPQNSKLLHFSEDKNNGLSLSI